MRYYPIVVAIPIKTTKYSIRDSGYFYSGQEYLPPSVKEKLAWLNDNSIKAFCSGRVIESPLLTIEYWLFWDSAQAIHFKLYWDSGV